MGHNPGSMGLMVYDPFCLACSPARLPLVKGRIAWPFRASNWRHAKLVWVGYYVRPQKAKGGRCTAHCIPPHTSNTPGAESHTGETVRSFRGDASSGSEDLKM